MIGNHKRDTMQISNQGSSGNLERLCQWFGDRIYPKDLIDKQVEGIKTQRSPEHNRKQRIVNWHGIPFVVTYHLCLPNLMRISSKYFYFLTKKMVNKVLP